MIHGLDTGFLVAAELAEHSKHAAARQLLTQLLGSGDTVGMAPQVLAEFIHVVTDSRRLQQPLGMTAAIGIAEKWWTARETVPLFPTLTSTQQFIAWLGQFGLGRKRLLDTSLAATYKEAGIQSILTTNPADFAVFGSFNCIVP